MMAHASCTCFAITACSLFCLPHAATALRPAPLSTASAAASSRSALRSRCPSTAASAPPLTPLSTPTAASASASGPASVSASASAASALLPLLAASVPGPVSAADGGGFSQASFYTTLALYVLALPGVVSLVKRSTQAKVVKKTYEVAGPAADGGRPTREVAADIVAFFQANNYKIKDARDVIIFEGVQAPLTGRAAFLTFCVFVALGSLALVLTILEQNVFGEGNGLGNWWYLSTLASPVAGKYYLDNAERTDEVSVKIITDDEELSSEVVVMGNEEEVDRFQKTLDMREKGMVYVKGILEG